MGLTVNNSIAGLEARVCELENQLKILMTVVFDGAVLSLPDDSWENIRLKRDYLLKSSDWTMIPGASVDQASWAAYRQVLRDLPQVFKSSGPKAVKWPKEPATSGPNTTAVE
jgi:hypothetical protein